MRKTIVVLTIVVILSLAVAGTAFAISNGQPDGDNHPYVGIALGQATGGGYWVCSMAAISPTVLVTAAHCFEGPDVWVSFDEVPTFTNLMTTWPSGTWTPNPDYCPGCGKGASRFRYT